MEVTKKITLKLLKKGDNFIVGDLMTLGIVMGTQSACSNLHIYHITKDKDGRWVVPMDEVKKRVAMIESRIKDNQSKVEMMKEIL